MNRILLMLSVIGVLLLSLVFVSQTGAVAVDKVLCHHDLGNGACVENELPSCNMTEWFPGACTSPTATPTLTPTPTGTENNDKVRICHGTDSVSNPYTTPEVDKSSTDAEGHAGHTGPVPANETEAQALKDAKTQWGDIIPPYPQSGVVGGLNWTPLGEAMWNNNCNYVTTTPTATPTPGGNGGGNPGGPGDGLGCATHSCEGNPSSSGPTQAVLGLSTTDSGANIYFEIAQLLAVLGLTATGYKFLQKNA